MQTRFTEAQRQDAAIRASEEILRKCVHCGFCSATCPTYTLLGDELDSPRGRIYLIKDMLENGRPATADVVRHVDRCLSCLACMTTCPSGVHYQHLIDHARTHIERTYRRSWHDRWLRRFLAAVMPYPQRFRLLLVLARWLGPLRSLMPKRIAAALSLVPGRNLGSAAAARREGGQQATAAGSESTSLRARVGVMTGCVQSVLGGSANAATVRLLERMGIETVEIAGCCGSLTHHLGQAAETRRFVQALISEFRAGEAGGRLDAIAVNASGCGTHLKDIGFVFREDAELAGSSGEVAALTRDITEVVSDFGMPRVTRPGGLRVAYHAACSLQHGQQVHAPPRELLQQAGFEVVEIPEGHLCCGSAGTYNMLQPEMAAELGRRKLGHIATLGVDCIAAGNLGCMTQLAQGADQPIVHTVELLDWATGGPVPPALAQLRAG